jgi:hypothetical protein
MAIASVKITCTTCGKDFEHRKECHNRTEANEYESWAVNHIDTCPACHAKRKASEEAERLSAVLSQFGRQLPDITGVSDKQTAYAAKVRSRYLSDNLKSVNQYLEAMQALDDPNTRAEFAKNCEAHGIAFDDAVRENLEYLGLITVQMMLTSTSAQEILDYRR